MILVRILCEHFTVCSDPSLHNAMFLLLFHPSVANVPGGENRMYANPNTSSNPYNLPPYGPQNVANDNPLFNKMNPTMYCMRRIMSSGNFYERKDNNDKSQMMTNDEGKFPNRMDTLAALMSLAVATKNTTLLERIAVWMQVCLLAFLLLLKSGLYWFSIHLQNDIYLGIKIVIFYM